jgi:Domain of unknown function (DUF4055)
MGIDSKHPAFKDYEDQFTDSRNAFEGGRAIKAAGERYLPKLKSQEPADYRAYLDRALFFSITAKTIAALVGLVMMRTPIVKASDGMDAYFKENQGSQFLEICSTTMQEVLLMGGYGIYIDAPQSGGDPEIVRYVRESIINWRVDSIGNPTLVVLKEGIYQQKTDDEYEFELVTQYRKLYLGADGFYHVQVFNEKKEAGPVITPTVAGQMLRYIPFYLINPLGVSMDVHKPPVIDIVDLNISHYRTSADLEHGRHFTGLPTPVVTGVEGGTDLYIGSQAAWILPNPDAEASYLEFTGQGLQSLEKAMTEKQSQMASMSARLIDNSKRGSEAAETVKLRYMSETASLITVVRSVEEGMNKVYSVIAEMKGEPKPEIDINKEFMEGKMSAADLTAIVTAYLEGGISKDTLIYNLRKGDVISRTQADDDEKKEIKRPPVDTGSAVA